MAQNDYLYYDAIQNIVPYFYYRLKSIDLDNGTSYSNIIKIALGAQNENIVISPNPFTNFLNIETNSSIESVSMWDMTGKRVYHQINPDSKTLHFDRSLPKGMYIVQINTLNNVLKKQIIHL